MSLRQGALKTLFKNGGNLPVLINFFKTSFKSHKNALTDFASVETVLFVFRNDRVKRFFPQKANLSFM